MIWMILGVIAFIYFLPVLALIVAGTVGLLIDDDNPRMPYRDMIVMSSLWPWVLYILLRKEHDSHN